jgi:urease accessory protein
MSAPTVLLLADSRLPSGGHGHSGGVEMAVAAGLVSTVDDLGLFLRGRLCTGALAQAAFSSAACVLAAHDEVVDWARWDGEFSARTPSAAVRAASRAQGSALLRTVSGMWTTKALRALAVLGRPHQPLVLGAACSAGGGNPADAAALAVHHLVAGACSAALRLLGLDPLEVAALQARLSEQSATTATSAAAAAETAVWTQDPTLLPALGAPMPDVLAARHAQTEVTFFAS